MGLPGASRLDWEAAMVSYLARWRLQLSLTCNFRICWLNKESFTYSRYHVTNHDTAPLPTSHLPYTSTDSPLMIFPSDMADPAFNFDSNTSLAGYSYSRY
jgi:hypothetical protein